MPTTDPKPISTKIAPIVAPKNERKIIQKENITQFYFPNGKPLSKEVKEETELQIQKAFEGKNNEIEFDDFEPIVTEVCKIPKICKKLLFERIKVIEKLPPDATKIQK